MHEQVIAYSNPLSQQQSGVKKMRAAVVAIGICFATSATVPKEVHLVAETNPVNLLSEADARAQITRACTIACDGSVNPISGPSSMCVTPCETEAYRCLDANEPHDLVSRVEKCKAEVVPKYETTEPGCCNFIARGKSTQSCKCNKIAAQVSKDSNARDPINFLTEADARAQITRACTIACDGSDNPISGPSSMCVTPCETEAYRCLDHDDPHDLVSRVEKCEAEVVPKYKTTEPGCCNLLARAKTARNDCNCKKTVANNEK